MKSLLRLLIATVVFGLTLRAAPAADRPNFVVVLGEGAGWSSSSVQMDDRDSTSKSTTLHTPSLERLAAAGMRFAQGYAASPRCTPSRAALFTGLSPAALHMTFVGTGKREKAGTGEPWMKVLPPLAQLELPESTTTIAELLHRTGYATAHFGKWHVGRANPSRHGFDENDGPTGNGGPDEVASPNPKQALAMTAHGIDFMTRQVKAGRPFYLQLSHYPDQPEKGSERNRPAADIAEEARALDQTLGQLLDAIEQLGLQDKTYVIYTTDHGTLGKNIPLAGGKGTVSEGGLRVPFVVAGPGIAAGACSHVRVSALDFFPTFAELAHVTESLPAELEGGSLVPVFMTGGAETVSRPREEFVVHFPHYDSDPLGPASALFLGSLKLIRFYATGESRLYDLDQDKTEHHNLASSQPEALADLDARLTAYLAAVKAQLPLPNPHYDPDASAAGAKGKRPRSDHAHE